MLNWTKTFDFKALIGSVFSSRRAVGILEVIRSGQLRRVMIGAAISALLATMPCAAAIMLPGDFQMLLISGRMIGPQNCTNPRRDIDERISACEQFVGIGLLRNQHAQILFFLGNAYRERRNFAASIDAFGKIVQLEGDPYLQSAGYAERGVTYAAAKQYDKALADADAIVAMEPGDPTSYNNRCWIRAIAERDLDTALADCNSALRLNGGREVLDSRGLVEFKQGNLQAALADFNSILDIHPKYISSLYLRGIVKLRMGDRAGADADFAAAKELVPRIADIFAVFGITP
jgi:tetratricopeptide (TPR) repeat protein